MAEGAKAAAKKYIDDLPAHRTRSNAIAACPGTWPFPMSRATRATA
ncbi:hypothetical protein [Actinomadura spongiicola]|nr:hypothetical protein [Actinomadura spongiicola]